MGRRLRRRRGRSEGDVRQWRNDFVIAGDSSDTVFGNEGDDWIEGGAQADLLQGENGDPFQEGRTGDDVIVGDGGDDDYGSEGGDDVMVTGPGIERNEGMIGFDWVTHRGDPQPANADMRFTGLLPPDLDNIRDRFDNVEGLSGWDKSDVLRGDDTDAAEMAGDHEPTRPELVAGCPTSSAAHPGSPAATSSSAAPAATSSRAEPATTSSTATRGSTCASASRGRPRP